MGAYKNLCIEAAEAGMCLVSPAAWSRLDDVECERGLDWIEYCEHDYEGRDGRLHVADAITLRSARRLVAEGLACDEITFFVECFGDCEPGAGRVTSDRERF